MILECKDRIKIFTRSSRTWSKERLYYFLSVTSTTGTISAFLFIPNIKNNKMMRLIIIVRRL